MKKLVMTIAIWLIMVSAVHASSYYTVGGYVACFSKRTMEQVIEIIVANNSLY